MTVPRDYRLHHEAIAMDIITMLQQHPDAFDALLYRARLSEPESVAAGIDVAGALDTSERTLGYDDPASCRAMIVPESAPFPVTLDGATSMPCDEPVVLLLSEQHVPQQSVVQWSEYTDHESAMDVILYVWRSEQAGVAPGVYSRLYCLPMQAFADLL